MRQLRPVEGTEVLLFRGVEVEIGSISLTGENQFKDSTESSESSKELKNLGIPQLSHTQKEDDFARAL